MMGYDIDNGSTPVIMFKLVDTDGVTPVTGLAGTMTVTLSKNGANFDAATNSPAEVLWTDDSTGTGIYKIALTATETNTNGPLWLHVEDASALDWDDYFQVVDAQPDVNVYSVESGVTIDANIVSEDAGYTPSDATLATATIESIASEVLGRTVAEARSDGNLPADEQYTLAGAILATAGKNAISGSTLNTYEEGEVNIAFSRTVTTNASAEPITSVA